MNNENYKKKKRKNSLLYFVYNRIYVRLIYLQCSFPYPPLVLTGWICVCVLCATQFVAKCFTSNDGILNEKITRTNLWCHLLYDGFSFFYGLKLTSNMYTHIAHRTSHTHSFPYNEYICECEDTHCRRRVLNSHRK